AATSPGQPDPSGSSGSAASIFGRIILWCVVGLTAMTIAVILTVVSLWATAEFGALPMASLVILLGAGVVIAALGNRRQLAAWSLAAALVIAVPMAIVSIADLRIEGGYGDLQEEPRF